MAVNEDGGEYGKAIRRDVFALVTASLGGEPLSRAVVLGMITEQGDAAYAAELIRSMADTMAQGMVMVTGGSSEGAQELIRKWALENNQEDRQ